MCMRVCIQYNIQKVYIYIYNIKIDSTYLLLLKLNLLCLYSLSPIIPIQARFDLIKHFVITF